MMGKQVPITPGWDCHGLPIENRVRQEQPGLSNKELKKACRAYANKWIDIQREEFKRMGVLMNWKHPYLTMSYDYEASILRAFSAFVKDGYIERKNKTVPWCPFDQTVLASAEIEYQERKDPSIYVLFPFTDAVSKKLFPSISGVVNLLVWTTTPWTLPLNRAVLIKPDATYVVMEHQGIYWLVAQELADKIAQLLGIVKNVVATVSAQDILRAGPQAKHPFVVDLVVPVLGSQNVLLGEGTACVHCAPGCGPEDYETGVINNLEIYSPITPDGKYAKGIVPTELEGTSVADGQGWVIKTLEAHNALLHKTSIRHSYPHCWRCRNGLIFRATKQWFCDLSKHDLKNRVLSSIKTIKTLPENSANRLLATVEGRLEWCLSRQRVWGIPIPAIICKSCDCTYITPELIEKVAHGVEQHGIEYWDTVSTAELLPAGFGCGNCKATEFEKEQDILDVWFDSGVSHYAVLKGNKELAFPADMYAEGKDQHRGWFQSSLLTAQVIEDQPPMRTILTHGFTVDEKGRKMSKSLGNGVEPQQMIDQLGTDGLRLWVASIDYADDAVVSKVLTENVKEVFRKVRNTCRFLLSNLYDFDIKKDAVAIDQLQVIDQYAMQELFYFNARMLRAYNNYELTSLFQQLAEYCSVNLSAFYLDIIKDRLYVEKANGKARRSAQTACWHILDTLTRLMAPILSFTAEQISDLYQKDKKNSIHLQTFNTLPDIWKLLAQKNSSLRTDVDLANVTQIDMRLIEKINQLNAVVEHESEWAILKEVRSAVLKAIEGLREKGIIKHSLEARVTLYINQSEQGLEPLTHLFAELDHVHQTVQEFFKEFFIVSQVVIATSAQELPQSAVPGLYVGVEQAHGVKCPRCWNWDVTDHPDNLCARCQRVLTV